MRLKSFVVAIVALFVIANVIVAAVRRSGIIPNGASDLVETAQRLRGATSPADGVVPKAQRTGVVPARPPAGIGGCSCCSAGRSCSIWAPSLGWRRARMEPRE